MIVNRLLLLRLLLLLSSVKAYLPPRAGPLTFRSSRGSSRAPPIRMGELAPRKVVVRPGTPAVVARWLERAPPKLRRTYAKLFTNEDRFAGVLSPHKLLGLSCLAHSAYRFARVGPADMGFGPTAATLACIGLHATLSASSFLFRVPLRRKVSYGIWREYRLHSIVFTLRSLAMMLLIWVEGALGLAPNHLANALICMAGVAASDWCTRAVGPEGRSRTVRDLDGPHAMRFGFAAMQIQTTSAVVLGHRRFSMHFIFAFIVQFNAFLMTLRRKNLTPYWFVVTTCALRPLPPLRSRSLVSAPCARAPDAAPRHADGALTVFGSAIVLYETNISAPGLFLVGNTLGNVATVLRIGFGTSRYLLWPGMAVLAHFARKTLPPPSGTQAIGAAFPHWPALAMLSNACLLAVGLASRPRPDRGSAPPADVP